MKTIILILLVILAGCKSTETVDNTYIGGLSQSKDYYIEPHNPHPNTDLCEERGHVNNLVYSSTAMYCPPYLIENDTISVMVYPSCNTTTYTCGRCGKTIQEPEKERKVVIWRKEQ